MTSQKGPRFLPADRIIVLDQGRVSEAGTYDELITQAGGFFEMVTLQEDRG
ncbi:hypothetical protein [Streptomyces sp. MAR4 CNX-425]|uniref:hypothetical protein n=1 Tax=Streptomyces sp. MAR4 CNX-425 TaxID=3406343 RepID=UPI003B509154